ncbi:MAG TPA: arylsulfotransferase family protein [Galbitalea sp.]|nr:arylsulfotransferase family protein [Galbitalea sp.]
MSDSDRVSKPATEPNGQVTKRQLPYTRRGFLALGAIAGGGVALAVVAGELTSPHSTATTTPATGPLAPTLPVRSFKSTNLKAQSVVTRQLGETAPGYLFIEPETATVFHGMIMDNSGDAVWIGPAGIQMTDVKVQSFEGKPVLTFWSGTVDLGHGDGVGNILDTSYRTIAKVKTGPGMNADLHEFHLTPWGTALMTAYPTAKADLTAVKGPRNGYIMNCHVQEVDVKTGAVLLDWSAQDHIDLADTYAFVANQADGNGKSAASPFDPFHFNSIDYDADGTTLYISARHMHTVYAVDRKSGAIKWRMGGRKNEFTIAKNAQFAWQHHVRKRSDGVFTLFNNHSRTAGDPTTSQAFVLNVDEAARTVGLQKSYDHGILAPAEGSVQPLVNGNVLIGWGDNPVVTEYTGDGRLVYEMTHVGTATYRVFRSEWVASPTTVPDIAASIVGNKTRIYVSWNGATEVRHWRILTGDGASSLSQAMIVPRSGFETASSVPRAAAVAVQALDFRGNVLATSRVVRTA